jgi:hypothetical protein
MTDTPTFEWPEEIIGDVERAITSAQSAPHQRGDVARAALSAIAPQVGKLVEAARIGERLSYIASAEGALAGLQHCRECGGTTRHESNCPFSALEPWRRT